MGDVREQLALGIETGRDALQHSIKGGPEPAHLVIGPALGAESRAEVARARLHRRPRDRADGAQQPLHHQERAEQGRCQRDGRLGRCQQQHLVTLGVQACQAGGRDQHADRRAAGSADRTGQDQEGRRASLDVSELGAQRRRRQPPSDRRARSQHLPTGAGARPPAAASALPTGARPRAGRGQSGPGACRSPVGGKRRGRAGGSRGRPRLQLLSLPGVAPDGRWKTQHRAIRRVTTSTGRPVPAAVSELAAARDAGAGHLLRWRQAS